MMDMAAKPRQNTNGTAVGPNNLANLSSILLDKYSIVIKDSLIEKYSLYDKIILNPHIVSGQSKDAEQMSASAHETLVSLRSGLEDTIGRHESNIQQYRSNISSTRSQLLKVWFQSISAGLSKKTMGVERFAYKSLMKKLKSNISKSYENISSEKRFLSDAKKNSLKMMKQHGEVFTDTMLHDEISESYPAIDLSFLSRIQDDYKYKEIRYKTKSAYSSKREERTRNFYVRDPPRFAVYHHTDYESKIIMSHIERRRGGETKKNESTVRMIALPKDISNQLLGGLCFDASGTDGYAYRLKVNLSIKSYFDSLIPDDVKSAIRKAEKYFGKDIYIVSEAKWMLDGEKFAADAGGPRSSMVIGLSNGNVPGTENRAAYLIKTFRHSPFELSLRELKTGQRVS